MFKIFRPHKPTKDRKLYRCDCGELFWSNSPQEVHRKHAGHRCRMAMGGSFFELIKIKLGLIK